MHKLPSQTESADDAAFSSIDLVGQCLVDKTRCAAFEQAIRRVVRPHHHVVDVGTGSGILALFAARAGARKVTAIEYDSYVAHVARENIRANGCEHLIEIIEADARDCRLFETLPQHCQDYSCQIADDLVFAYLDVSEMGETDCFNHSCDPNAGISN